MSLADKYPHACFRVRDHHPIANIFPMLDGKETWELQENIVKNGMIKPITLFEDMVLDGRNRQHAAACSNYIPTFVNFVGTYLEAQQYAWAENMMRRHLNSSQIAMAIAERELLAEKYFNDNRVIESDDSLNFNERFKDDPKQCIYKAADEVRAKRPVEAGLTNSKYVKVAKRLMKERDLVRIQKVKEGRLSLSHVPSAKAIEEERQAKVKRKRRPMLDSVVKSSPFTSDEFKTSVLQKQSGSGGVVAPPKPRQKPSTPSPQRESSPAKHPASEPTKRQAEEPLNDAVTTTGPTSPKPSIEDLTSEIQAMIGDRRGEFYPAICNRTNDPTSTQLVVNPFNCESAGQAIDIADTEQFRKYVGRFTE